MKPEELDATAIVINDEIAHVIIGNHLDKEITLYSDQKIEFWDVRIVPIRERP